MRIGAAIRELGSLARIGVKEIPENPKRLADLQGADTLRSHLGKWRAGNTQGENWEVILKR
jgi:hypothetical protein